MSRGSNGRNRLAAANRIQPDGPAELVAIKKTIVGAAEQLLKTTQVKHEGSTVVIESQGDGATLLNDVNAEFDSPNQITPLDTLFSRLGSARVAIVGVRLRRRPAGDSENARGRQTCSKYEQPQTARAGHA